MNSKKVFFIMLGTLTLLGVMLVAAVVFGDSLLKKQSQHLVSLKLDSKIAEAQQTALIQAKQGIKDYEDKDKIAKQIVPQDKDQARATREIVNIAHDSGVQIASVSFPLSNLGQTPPPSSSTTTDDNGGSSTPAAPKAPPVTQVQPVSGISGLYQLDITVTSDSTQPSTFNEILGFLERLENNRRTAQVSKISIEPNGIDRSLLSFDITVTVYVKP